MTNRYYVIDIDQNKYFFYTFSSVIAFTLQIVAIGFKCFAPL